MDNNRGYNSLDSHCYFHRDEAPAAMLRKKLVMPCEVYSRVVGYYRPVQAWNSGKKQEFKERKPFNAEIITK